jgi:uncharacterized protein (DUF58 family)
MSDIAGASTENREDQRVDNPFGSDTSGLLTGKRELQNILQGGFVVVGALLFSFVIYRLTGNQTTTLIAALIALVVLALLSGLILLALNWIRAAESTARTKNAAQSVDVQNNGSSDVHFDAEFLKKLELLHILSKRLLREKNKGERRHVSKGTSVEFKDYREYVVGDDTRYVDWNIYQRLDRLLVKLYEEEIEHYIYLLIDGSMSMNFGSPTKLVQAKLISAALSYIALANQDRVSVGIFRNGLKDQIPPAHGKAQIWNIFKFLERIQAKEETNVNASCKEFALRTKRRGIAIILSDFLDPKGLEEGLKQFIYRKYELYLVHIVSPQDENPKLQGELTIVDSETDEAREVSVDEQTLGLYRSNFKDWVAEIESYCKSKQVTYLRAPTGDSFDDIVLKMFREGHLLR